jgi:hypothetical protein
MVYLLMKIRFLGVKTVTDVLGGGVQGGPFSPPIQFRRFTTPTETGWHHPLAMWFFET